MRNIYTRYHICLMRVKSRRVSLKRRFDVKYSSCRQTSCLLGVSHWKLPRNITTLMWTTIVYSLSQVLISRLCTADSAMLVIFQGSLLRYYTLLVEYCCASSILGICNEGTAKNWQYFVRLVLRVQVLRVLRVHGVVPKYSQYAQYTGSVKYISTIYLCTPVSIISTAFHCRQL